MMRICCTNWKAKIAQSVELWSTKKKKKILKIFKRMDELLKRHREDHWPYDGGE
jgi:hypothetical protein